jgi:hypothetical protein
MPGDRAPTIPSHCGGSVMIAADAERHALGGAAGELRMEQRVELIAVACGKGRIKRAGEIGRGDFVHPDEPPSKFAVLAADWENSLEATKCKCYYSNGQSDYF